MMPSLLIDDLLRLLRIFVIALENVGSLDTHFALVVLRPILHLRHVNELHAAAGNRRSHVTRDVVPLDGQGDGRRTFCLAVSLYDLKYPIN